MNSENIKFFSQDIDFILEKPNKIAKVLKDYVASENKVYSEINYIFCSDEYLLELNRQYLRHDYYTDILSFQMDNDPIQGDIYVSIDRVKDNAKELNIIFEKELLRVISHGLLHFLGYKDATDEEKLIMRAKEDELIEKLI